MIIGAIVGAVAGWWVKWVTDASLFPPFKGWRWTTALIAYGALIGALAAWPT